MTWEEALQPIHLARSKDENYNWEEAIKQKEKQEKREMKTDTDIDGLFDWEEKQLGLASSYLLFSENIFF